MKTILIILFLLIATKAFCPDLRRAAIICPESINPYEAIIKAVVTVESKGDTFAYNPVEGAVGAFQVRQIKLDEYNRLTGEMLKLSDCYKYETSKRIFLYFASQIDYRDVKSICIKWNGKSTHNKYYKKVKAELWNMQQETLARPHSSPRKTGNFR